MTAREFFEKHRGKRVRYNTFSADDYTGILVGYKDETDAVAFSHESGAPWSTFVNEGGWRFDYIDTEKFRGFSAPVGAVAVIDEQTPADDRKWPHRCLKCGGPALSLFTTTECKAGCR